MASEITPGLYMLPLPINKDINIDKEVVETKLRDLEHFLQVRVGRPEEFAILNLQGLLTLRLHRYEEAIGYFNGILVKDSENLNALANLQYVLEKLFRLAEAKYCKDEWVHLIKTEDQDPESLQKENCLKARCLAEQAYAYAFDIHSDTLGGKRYMQSNELFRKALELAGKAVDTTEKDDWKLSMAFNAHKLFDNLWYEDKIRAAEEYIDIAVKLFFEITQRSPGDAEFQWDSWRHLGDIFRALKIRKIKREVPLGLKEYQDDPEKCMMKAMEITPNNARLLARYANFLYSLNKEIQKPLELLEQSISLDSSEFNFYAFTTRAMINIKFYSVRLKQTEQEGHMKDSSKLALLRNVLQIAKSDLLKAMSMHVTPWDLTRLGEVYYLLAKHHTEQDSEVRFLVEKALLYSTRAADCQDGYKRQEVHLMRGRCLFDIGEKRSAIGCFKQAIDCEPPTSKYTGNFNKLLLVYLSILQEETLEDKSVMAEIAFSLHGALVKYGKGNMNKYCIGKLRLAYNKELKIIAEYCRQYYEHHELVSLLEADGTPPATSTIISAKESTLHQSWRKTFHSPRARRVGPEEDMGHGLVAAAAATQHVSDAVKTESEVDDSVKMAEGDMKKEGMREKDVKSIVAGVKVMNIQEQGLAKEQPIRKAPEEARVANFLYDFFVVYPESEKGWVSYDLLNELEGIRKLRGCTRHRDALPGKMVFTSQIELMKKSASILLIINNDFQKDCDTSMHYALNVRKSREDREHSRVIIPVLRDDSQVPDEIDIFNTFEAVGAVDWDRLALTIEQQI